jgi:site-specific DNA recombinase
VLAPGAVNVIEGFKMNQMETAATQIGRLFLSTRYRELIEDLARSLNAPDVKREAAEALRALISEVRMVPDATARNGHGIELVGELAGILSLGDFNATKPPRFARALSETLVAGVGFEPTTFRL